MRRKIRKLNRFGDQSNICTLLDSGIKKSLRAALLVPAGPYPRSLVSELIFHNSGSLTGKGVVRNLITWARTRSLGSEKDVTHFLYLPLSTCFYQAHIEEETRYHSITIETHVFLAWPSTPFVSQVQTGCFLGWM